MERNSEISVVVQLELAEVGSKELLVVPQNGGGGTGGRRYSIKRLDTAWHRRYGSGVFSVPVPVQFLEKSRKSAIVIAIIHYGCIRLLQQMILKYKQSPPQKW